VAPRITDFTPVLGSPGEVVTINGANFIPGATVVEFNGARAAVEVTAPTQLQAIVPEGARTGPISVSTFAGTATSATSFTVGGPGPVILGFEPTSGRVGEAVVIMGVRFTGVTAVRFNGTNTVFSITADTQIQTTVPAGAKTGPISVVGPLGSAFSEAHFQVLTPAPAVAGFTPTSGPEGASVTISGQNFTGVTGVTFGGSAATFSVTADTQIQATVPSGAKTGVITVSRGTESVSSQAVFTVTAAPSITEFAPASGAPGDQVIVNGDHFTGTTAVKFGGVSAVFTVTADTQLQTVVPGGATNAPISVTTPAGTAVSAASFIVLPPGPIVSSFEPTAGLPGAAVTIEGVHFTGATAVRFGGRSAAFDVTSDAQIRAVVPADGTTGPITVSTPGGTHVTSTLFFVAPRIVSFMPTNGAPETEVLIQGASFTGATAVTFNGTSTAFSVLSAEQISTRVPAGASSGPVTVTAPGGTAISPADFVVPVSITSFTPAAGPPGTVVKITGASFSGATAVYFGGVPGTFTVNSAALITAVVPATASTGPIAVVTPQGAAISAVPFVASVSSDLTVTLTDGLGPALAGNAVPYVAEVRNEGPSRATGVVLSSRLPAGPALVSFQTSQGSTKLAEGMLIAELGAVEAGAAARCVWTLSPPTPGVVTNLATVAANEFDPAPANNSVVLATTVRDLFELNLLRNGDAESGPGATTGNEVVPVPGWETEGNLTVIPYGLGAGYPSPTSPGPTTRGQQLFYGGPNSSSARGIQRLDLLAAAATIDRGDARYELSGFLGGSIDQADHAAFQATFFNATNVVLAKVVIGPVTAEDRTNTTSLFLRTAAGSVPTGARRVELSLQLTRGSGTANDGLADNLSFVLTAYAEPRLTMERAERDVVVSWPKDTHGLYVLQAATKPAPGATWALVGESPVAVGDRWVVTNRTSLSQRFYRLWRP
jgi:uncharacterized repeat protein (TIGR01451 family)